MKRNISYVSGTSDQPLMGYTIGDFFDDIVKKFPHNEALVVRHQNVRWTYSELKKHVDECARAFLALGVKVGDRVGVWSPNCSEWTVAQFATAKIGAILVNLNPSYRLHELEYALNQSGCKYIVIADKFKKSDYTGMVYDLAPQLYHFSPGELRCEKLPKLKGVIRLAEDPMKGMWSWNQFLMKADAIDPMMVEERQAQLSFDDPINIQYTSGTTGLPKGACLSHHGILNNGFFVGEMLEFTDKDRLCIPVPLYHSFGMVVGNMVAITHGACMIYPGEGFDPKEVLASIEEERATSLYGVPTMFIAELEDPDFFKFDLSSLRTGMMAGSPCPIEVMKKVRDLMHMKDIQIAYGMTETSPVSTQTRPNTPVEKRVGTVGKIHPHQEIKIVNPETGRIVALGESGELCMRGYNIMLGYWDNKKQTNEVIDSTKWMHSGDLATMDEEGYIKIVGRIKDMIIRGGENIYPREIEEFLHTHPKIADVQIIGVPDLKYGEEVMAWIQLKEGENLTDEEVKDFCRGQIAHYKIPKYYRFTDYFPMTVTGKIRKIEMREISIKELHLEEAASEKMA